MAGRTSIRLRRGSAPFIRAYVAPRSVSNVIRMRTGMFDEYLLLTIVEDALRIGAGGRLRVVLSAAERFTAVVEVVKAVTWLRSKGLKVTVQVEPESRTSKRRRHGRQGSRWR
jgi:hypothetical protein